MDARGLEVRERNDLCGVGVSLGGYEPRRCEVGEGRGGREVLDGHGDCLRLVSRSLVDRFEFRVHGFGVNFRVSGSELRASGSW